MAVSKRLRYEILRRDNHACRYCGASAPDVHLTVDHVLPVALGGTDEATNLVAACADCNSGKSSSNPDQPLVDQVSEDAIRWTRALALARQMLAMERHQAVEAVDTFLETWNSWVFGFGSRAKPAELPPDWKITVQEYVRLGLTDDDIEEAVDSALGRRNIRDRFSYFVGVCRTKIKAREDKARELIESGEV